MLIYNSSAFGTDLVYNFEVGLDPFNFAGSGARGFDQLMISVIGGSSVVTSAATVGSEIWVIGVIGLTAGDFLFT